MYPGQSSKTYNQSPTFPLNNFAPPTYPYQPGQQPYYPPPPPPPTGQPVYYAPAPYPPPQQYAPPPNNMPPPYPQGVNPRDQGGYTMHVHQDMAGQPPPNFQLSNCGGRKRGLFIGINYFGQSSELRGCINDAHNMRNFLIQNYGYRPEDIVMLTDDNPDASFRPTRANMINAMNWLVHDARPNDAYFFHYSGHGGQTPDLDGDEESGFDETIYPVDHQRAGMIVDDEMHAIMVRNLPLGCRLTAIFDSCHSGTALDLPYVYSTTGTIKDNKWKSAGQDVLTTAVDYARGDIGGMLTGLMGLGKKIINAPNLERAKAMRTSQADVIMFSGCKDDQTSADVTEAGRATGAMSHAFILSLSRNRNQSYTMLLNDLRAIMANKYSQRPQLSASHPMDMNLLFIC